MVLNILDIWQILRLLLCEFYLTITYYVVCDFNFTIFERAYKWNLAVRQELVDTMDPYTDPYMDPYGFPLYGCKFFPF